MRSKEPFLSSSQEAAQKLFPVVASRLQETPYIVCPAPCSCCWHNFALLCWHVLAAVGTDAASLLQDCLYAISVIYSPYAGVYLLVYAPLVHHVCLHTIYWYIIRMMVHHAAMGPTAS